jgi:uncharacterized integral membrane protein (TIGR00698 family)
MAQHRTLAHPFQFSLRWLTPLLPGILICAAVSCAAILAERFQVRLAGHAWLGDLVLAILIGTLLRSLVSLPAVASAGIKFSAKTLLEIAVALLGASLSLSILKGAGGLLIGGIALIVALSLVVSYAAGRMLGLPPKLATLIACGNSICGNSAIAAAAPAIGAKPEDVAASIAFTAVLGVAAVLLMPFLPQLLGLDATQYGIFAGLTVYAVPQVLAATAPLGAIAVQTGTIVKLIRVLMLGPVIAALSVIHGRSDKGRLKLQQMVPWFIIGFVAMIVLRSLGAIPAAALPGLAWASGMLTVLAMAGLGLQTDIRAVARAGGRVILAAVLSLAALLALALLAIRLLGL